MFNVHQHWDPLNVCIVGRSYPPEFYHFIKNSQVRKVLEKIAEETEEDYQKLINLLESFGVRVLRPNVCADYEFYLDQGKILPPPMTPRDYSMMLGNDFFFKVAFSNLTKDKWEEIKGSSWPENLPKTNKEFKLLSKSIQTEIDSYFPFADYNHLKFSEFSQYHFNLIPNCKTTHRDDIYSFTWKDIIDEINLTNRIYHKVPSCFRDFNSAMNTRIGKDIYAGTVTLGADRKEDLNKLREIYPQYRWHSVDTGGHGDGCFCPVVPGLIISLLDIQTYAETFPGWEVVYLPNQSWDKVRPFLHLKKKNKGKWWVPGEEYNDEFINFVESWLDHWVGYVEETVFDVNMLVIDQKNVICNNYNEKVFEAFSRYGVTPHIINFRHRYFWDGGLHCITSDIHREGTMQDYFPERG